MGIIKGTKLEAKTFKPGNKLAHGGARKNTGPKPKEIKALEQAWKHDTKAVDRVMESMLHLALNSKDEAIKLAAQRSYLDRVVGRPKTQVDINIKTSELDDRYRGITVAGLGEQFKDLLVAADGAAKRK